MTIGMFCWPPVTALKKPLALLAKPPRTVRLRSTSIRRRLSGRPGDVVTPASSDARLPGPSHVALPATDHALSLRRGDVGLGRPRDRFSLHSNGKSDAAEGRPGDVVASPRVNRERILGEVVFRRRGSPRPTVVARNRRSRSGPARLSHPPPITRKWIQRDRCVPRRGSPRPRSERNRQTARARPPVSLSHPPATLDTGSAASLFCPPADASPSAPCAVLP